MAEFGITKNSIEGRDDRNDAPRADRASSRASAFAQEPGEGSGSMRAARGETIDPGDGPASPSGVLNGLKYILGGPK